MDRNLALEFVRVTEAGAIAAAQWLGRGDKKAADGAAVDEMRDRFNYVEGTSQCKSPRCNWDAMRRDLLRQSSVSGFGRLIEGKVFVHKGYLYGKIVEMKPEHLPEKELTKYEDNIKGLQKINYNYLLKKLGCKSLALKYMGYGTFGQKPKKGQPTDSVKRICKEW